MSLPVNNKTSSKQATNTKETGKGSKFLKSASKPANASAKKVRSTGGNRGS